VKITNRIIAIDFDGTLFEDDYPNMGAPIWPTINRAKKARESGDRLILWTLREKELLADAIMQCALVGLYFDEINTNLQDEVEKWRHDPRKVAADEYWDDRGAELKTCASCKHAMRPSLESELYFCKCEGSPCRGRMVTGDDYCRFAEMELNHD